MRPLPVLALKNKELRLPRPELSKSLAGSAAEPLVALAAAAALLGGFLFDLLTPTTVSVSSLAVVPVLLAAWLLSARAIAVVTAVAIALQIWLGLDSALAGLSVAANIGAVRSTFEKYGFWSLFVPALLPPPVPFTPFLIAAGALQYSRHRFFLAVGSARALRYGALAFLGSTYSKQIFGFFQKYYQPILWTFVALAVIGGGGGFYAWKRKHQRKPIIPGGTDKHPAKAA